MLALLACALNTPAFAQKMSDKDALVQRYYWYEELLASANSEDMIYLMTSDYTSVSINHVDLNKQQANAIMRLSVDAVHRVYAANVTINQLDIRGDYAIGLVTQYFNSDNRDPEGMVHRVISNMVARQLWVRTEDGWKIQRTRTLRGQIEVDGVLVKIPS